MNFPHSGYRRGENGKKVFVLLVEKTEGERKTSLRRRRANSYNVNAKHWNNDREAKSGEWESPNGILLVSRHLWPKGTLMKAAEFIWMWNSFVWVVEFNQFATCNIESTM